MKFTLSWLRDHLETTATLDEIATTLTSLGLEVEEVTDPAKDLGAFTVARVSSAEPHPNADKLRVCRVETVQGEVQVVCGAPNARTGMTGVFAPAGSHIPGTGIDLKPTKIRGVASNGMLVSEREMGLSDEHSGIIELSDEFAVGTPFATAVGLDDPVIEIALTPDRADCAGVRGIARDLAAAGLGSLKPLDTTPVEAAIPDAVAIRILDDAKEACPMFAGRLIRGVRNGPSPRWMQDRLRAIGLRPISALVDITNYVTMDLARPLHVFDADAVAGGIHVRLSRPGETLDALNGKSYTLDGEMTAVCDDRGVLGLGGIVGGVGSGCTEATRDVVIECALFDPIRTATTGRKLAIDSDARYRFERGVDPAAVRDYVEVATRWVQSLCGGEAGPVVVAGGEPAWQRSLTLRPTRVRDLGGVDVPAAEQRRILGTLGFGLSEQPDGSLAAAVPSWRGDVAGEADLVEEVLRVHGFDNIPAVSMPRLGALTRPALSPSQRRVAFARRLLADRGLLEAVTWSFLAPEVAARFGHADPELVLVNPISAELTVMRPSVLPNLIQAAGRNADRGFPDVGLYEVGPAYRDGTAEGQDRIAAGVRAGAARPRHWSGEPRPVDAFDAKADALALLAALGAPTGNLQVTRDAPDWYHPGRSGVLRLGPTVLARFGEIHPGVRERLEIKTPLVGFEVMLDQVPMPKRTGGTARPTLALSAFQPIQRDFAFVVDRSVEADRVVRAAKGADKTMIDAVTVFDVYEGTGVPEGSKSVALGVTLQPTERTLTEADIEAVAQKIVAAVSKATGATLRAG